MSVDIAHVIGADLSIGSTGDLGVASDSAAVQQRVLRRLVTNLGDYIWQLSYGGGLPSHVGATLDVVALQTAVRQQLLLETAVARVPVPTVSVSAGLDGSAIMTIRYGDAASGTTQTLTIVPGI